MQRYVLAFLLLLSFYAWADGLSEKQIALGIKTRELTIENAQKQFHGINMAKLMEFYEENAPDMLDEWRSRCALQQDSAQAYLNMLTERYIKIENLREKSPQDYAYNLTQLKNEMQLRKLSFKIREAQAQGKTGKELHNLQIAIAEILKNSFDSAQQKQQQTINRLENELNELKSHFQERTNNRDYILQQKFLLLTGTEWPEK